LPNGLRAMTKPMTCWKKWQISLFGGLFDG